jgi:hypothetical protein
MTRPEDIHSCGWGIGVVDWHRVHRQAPSLWQPYLQSIPSQHHLPIVWDDDQLSWLHGTNVHASSTETKAFMRQWYDCVMQGIGDTSLAALASVLSWDAMLWAHCAFASRAFPHTFALPPPTGPASTSPPPPQHSGCLLPFLDTYNHGYRTAITWTLTPDGVQFCVGDGVSAGHEIMNNYGPKVWVTCAPPVVTHGMFSDRKESDLSPPTVAVVAAVAIHRRATRSS